MEFKSWNELTTYCVFKELENQNIRNFFIAPGSRSTPLVIAAQKNSKIKIHTHYDERTLGYMAVGFAKAHNEPVGIITTSGTAVANLLPSVIEAYQSQTPLILITADRPYELLNNSSNQAIVQKNIFTDYTISQMDIPESSSLTSLNALISKTSWDILKCKEQKLPIHWNWHFQEPLVSGTENIKPDSFINNWLTSKTVWTANSSPENLNPILKNTKNGIIIAGSFLNQYEQNQILKISEKLKMPVLWDVQNTFKYQIHPNNISYYDFILDHFNFDSDCILHFGSTMTSKRLNQWIEKQVKKNSTYIKFSSLSQNTDSLNLPKHIISCPIEKVLEAFSSKNEESGLLSKLKLEVQKVEKYFSLKFENNLNEASLPYHFLKNTKDCNLFIGSSMPIRDLERFGGTGNIRLYSNRGASGIDGNIATAYGIAKSTQITTYAILGDQAFLYDLNSLSLLSDNSVTVKIIIVNNQGGGIFKFLPVQAIDSSLFQKCFINPHNFDFKDVSKFFNLNHILIRTVEDLKKSLIQDQSMIIELQTQINENYKIHQALTSEYK